MELISRLLDEDRRLSLSEYSQVALVASDWVAHAKKALVKEKVFFFFFSIPLFIFFLTVPFSTFLQLLTKA